MNNLLITVMAHSDAQATVNRHKPYWDALGGEVIYFCPYDSQVQVPGRQIVTTTQKRSHNGPGSIARFRYLLNYLHGCGADRHVIFEYDSICIGSLPDWPENMIAGNVFPENNTDGRFRAGEFIHPPLCFTHNILTLLVDSMRYVPNNAEGAFWDRWLGLVCQEWQIQMHNFMETGEGFSHNTIHEAHWAGARQARINGAKMFHGIKNAATLEAILK